MSNSVRPHRRQPIRLPRPWDSPGKNTRVGCHFLLQCIKVKSESEVAQSCPTLCDPMACSLPGSSVHGIFQARVLEWGAIAFSLLALNSTEDIFNNRIFLTAFACNITYSLRNEIIVLLQQKPWRRKWQPTPVLLPGKSHGQKGLVGYSPWGREEQDTTERLYFHFSVSCTGEGNGNPL